MGTASKAAIEKAVVFHECGVFTRVFGGKAEPDEVLGELIAQADKGLALNGDLVAYYQSKPCVPEKINAMTDDEWTRFLSRRFRHEKWRRLYLDTAHGRCCVAVSWR